MSQQSTIVPDAIKRELLQVRAVHFNVAQEYIMITEDKTYRCLREWKDNIETRKSWIAPVSLLIPLLLTFVTATFKDALGFPKETWQAIFLLGVVFSVIWSGKELISLITHRKRETIEQMIGDLKKGAVVQHTEIDGVKASLETSHKE